MKVISVPRMGAEDVVVDDVGAVWTGTEDGTIFRIDPDGGQVTEVAHTGGRPLGLEVMGEELLICDANKGLLAMDFESGRIRELLAAIDGVPMRFCNNAAVSASGDIWFSDSSEVHPITEWKAEMVEATRTGRLIHLREGRTEVRLAGLEFANGVALAADESFVVVAETGARRMKRLWLSGPKEGEVETFVEDLPAYPDNISTGSDGLIWVALASPRDPVVELIKSRAPLVVRRQVTRLPEWLQPAPKRTVRAAAYDAQGRLVHDIALDAAGFHMVTGVREHQGALWLGSLHEAAIARVELAGQG